MPEPRRLRVALVYDDSLDHFGGIPKYMTLLAGGLARAGCDVTLVVGDTVLERAAGCPVHSVARNVTVRFNGNRLRMPVVADRAAVRALATGRPFDVVHVQVPYSPIMAGHLIRRLPGSTALVGTFHVVAERTVPRIGARMLAAVTPRTLSRFDRMICVSECAARFAADTYGIRAPAIVPNMVELAALRSKVLPTSRPTIVFLGALVPRKGPAQLLEAFALVRDRMPAAQLLIGGDGPLRRSLERRIARRGLRDCVRLAGPIAEQDKAAWLAQGHVACFPSRYGESFGVVLLEAMAAGTAILAGSNSGYAEVLRELPDALCRPEPAPLAERLHALLIDDVRRRRLVQQQRETVARYDVGPVVAEVLDVYRDTLERRVTRRARDAFAA